MSDTYDQQGNAVFDVRANRVYDRVCGVSSLPGGIQSVYLVQRLTEADVSAYAYPVSSRPHPIISFGNDAVIAGTGLRQDAIITGVSSPGWNLLLYSYSPPRAVNVVPIYCYSHQLYTSVGWPFSISSKMKITGPATGLVTLHNAVAPGTQGNLFLDLPISTVPLNLLAGQSQEFRPLGSDAPAIRSRVYVFWANATDVSQLPAASEYAGYPFGGGYPIWRPLAVMPLSLQYA